MNVAFLVGLTFGPWQAFAFVAAMIAETNQQFASMGEIDSFCRQHQIAIPSGLVCPYVVPSNSRLH